MLKIEITCNSPGELRMWADALGGSVDLRMANTVPPIRYFYHPESDSLFTTNDDTRPIGDGLVEELSKEQFEALALKQSRTANRETADFVHTEVNPLADELAAMERPGDLTPPAATPGSMRVRGQPAPGKKRRTAAEVAEDLAHAQTDRPAQVPAAISTGESRINPEDDPVEFAQRQRDALADAADEAAESAARAGGPPTMDDLRAAVKRYADKFGPEAAIANVRTILGVPMLETPPDQIGNAIAKMDYATNGGLSEPQAAPTSLFDDAKPSRVAKREDIIAAMTAYCVKYDGTDDPNKAPNGQADLPRIMDKACGVTRISLLPQTPEGFGAAHAAILAATAGNPFGRPARQ